MPTPFLRGTITGDAETVASLDAGADALPESLARAINKQIIRLAAYVKSEKLSGQVLKNRSGTLRRSIASRLERMGREVAGYVFTRLRYGVAHELGFDGTVTVKEHLRTQTMAWGRAIDPRQVSVRAHLMRMRVSPKHFLRSSLEELGPSMLDAVVADVSRGIA